MPRSGSSGTPAASATRRCNEEPVTIVYTEYSMAKGQSLINGVNILFDSVLKTGTRR
jgi:hypothetical protein